MGPLIVESTAPNAAENIKTSKSGPVDIAAVHRPKSDPRNRSYVHSLRRAELAVKRRNSYCIGPEIVIHAPSFGTLYSRRRNLINARSVRATIEQLAELQVRVHCLALGGVDLASAAGKMTMAGIAAVAEFERDLLVERTQSGLERAKAQGKKLGRPNKLTPEQQKRICERRAKGESLGVLAKEYAVSRSAVRRVELEQATK